MSGAHSSEKGWTLGSQGAEASTGLVSAALVDPQNGGQTTLSTSQAETCALLLQFLGLFRIVRLATDAAPLWITPASRAHSRSLDGRPGVLLRSQGVLRIVLLLHCIRALRVRW
ncbi:jg4451 [Pararge aegeria aegeria]|uniref:Jg4451 protein n=1 Tax=Pararge aegeria aegeria TaxID=348720 RepID=A0A8S4S372_9NEOP|nr:jg4451 [Pararge aegeria aegeria]